MKIFVSDEKRRRNPNFSKLLDEINRKNSGSVLSKVESKFWLSKNEWLEEHIVFVAVQSVLNEMQLSILNNEMPEEQTKCWKAVMRCFYLNQCPNYLHTSGSLNPKDKIGQITEDHLSKGKLLLAGALENKLERVALKLVDARDGTDFRENATIRLARAMQIGSIFEEDKSILFNNKHHLNQLNSEEVNLQIEYHQALQESADLLMKLITKYVVRLQPLKDHAIAKNALISCETLTAKLKSIRMQLNCETYSPQAVEVLKKLRSEIIETIQERELRLADVEQQLEIFRKLGSGFEAIVTEYANAKLELEKQKWTLSEVKDKLKSS